MQRNSLELEKISRYYIDSGSYALLSLISFFINSDSVSILDFDPQNHSELYCKFQVPGRLGMLLTLTLISTNNYNSLDAPTSRGYSYIEIWYFGTFLPIVIAITEYGYILSQKRASKISQEYIWKIDLRVFQIVLIGFVLFVITYFTALFL